jgi:hypothetical protein
LENLNVPGFLSIFLFALTPRFLLLRPHILSLSPTDMKLLNQESKAGMDSLTRALYFLKF